MTVLQRRYFGFCCACVGEWLIHRPEYWLRAALSRWKTSPVDYGQIIWSLVDARIFVLGKGDRRAAPHLYTFSRNQKPSFWEYVATNEVGASYWDAQYLVVYFTFKETKFCSVYAVQVKFSWCGFASHVSRTKWCKQLTQASTHCVQGELRPFTLGPIRKRSARVEIKQEAARYCTDLQNKLDVAFNEFFLVIKAKWETTKRGQVGPAELFICESKHLCRSWVLPRST